MTGVSVLGPRPPRQLKGDSVERATLLPILFVVNGDGQNCHTLRWAFNGHFYSSSIPMISDSTDSGYNLYSVTTGSMLLQTCSVCFLLGKDYEDNDTKLLCHTEESATLLFIYIYTVIEYGHFRLKFAGISRLTLLQRVKSLQWVTYCSQLPMFSKSWLW